LLISDIVEDYLYYGPVLNFSSEAERLLEVENCNEVVFKNAI